MHFQKILPAIEDEGVGARAKRLIPGNTGHLDPFVIFDEYQVFKDSYFPEHPHSGFEGFQILMEGRTLYQDNQGNRGAIDPGDIRRFVAGNGFKHSERPDFDGTVRGYLLWIKIPSRFGDTPIIFHEYREELIPISVDNGLKIRNIMGEGSPVKTITPVNWKMIESSDRDAELTISKTVDENGFIHVASGSASFQDISMKAGEGALMKGEGKAVLKIGMNTEMVVIKGKKIGEPIVQEGHLVHWK